MLLLHALPGTASAQQNEPSVIQAVRTDEPIQIDGVLGEPAWGEAPRVSNFTQRELNEGAPASERTEVAVLYDDQFLYVGFWGYDGEPSRITAQKMERDFNWGSDDNFEVIIDTYNDDRNGYLFVINPNGARADALVIDNGSQMNVDWDGVWYVEARVTDEGWFAEMKIPFSTLKFSSAADQVWGINFERNIRRKREQVLWQGWSRDSDLEQVVRAGTLTGLEGISNVTLVEVRPYALGGAERSGSVRQAAIGDVGADVSYLVTPTVKLDFTINPDFAQVEADRDEVNLTRFSLFFPEKRKFFLEGRDFFEFDVGERIQPFYSRRIGLDRSGEVVPILGGARLLGKVGSATLGAMSLQTAEVAGSPTTNYTTLRWKQDVLEQSHVGLLSATRVQPGHLNTTYGADARYATSRLFGDKNFAAGGALARSYTSDLSDPTGLAHSIFITYPNDLIEFDAAWTRAGPLFNPEVGFLRREAFQEFFAELQFNPRPGSLIPWMQQAQVKPLDINYFVDERTGKMQSFISEFRPIGFGTKSGEFIEFNVFYIGERLTEPFDIVGGVAIPPDTYWSTRYEVKGYTFPGRRVFAEYGFNTGGFFGGRRTELTNELTWRTSKYLALSADFTQNRVSLPGGDFHVNEVGGRASFAFNPDLFGAFFGQWNSEDREVLLNFRINWIPKPGTDLYFVVNQRLDTMDKRWRPENTAFLTKFVWRFTI